LGRSLRSADPSRAGDRGALNWYVHHRGTEAPRAQRWHREEERSGLVPRGGGLPRERATPARGYPVLVCAARRGRAGRPRSRGANHDGGGGPCGSS
jgi:hypothetical protein